MQDVQLLLGCIADDFTGATDLANALTRCGLTTVVLLGVPQGHFPLPEAHAVVIALKSRSNPADEAVRDSLAALAWLRQAGAKQFYFKYCSTFDSTDAGNIGPVADALLAALRESFTVVCPAFPANRRTVYQGHLFVGSELLADSSMRHHPITPMADSSLVRVLGRQTTARVGLIPHATVARGAEAVEGEIRALQAQGLRYAVVDAVTDSDLAEIGRACAGLALVTGGSGLALGLPENFRRQHLIARGVGRSSEQVSGPAAVLAGSCSAATQRQVAAMAATHEAYALDPLTLAQDGSAVQRAIDWACARLGAAPLLIYSTANPEQVTQTQHQLGREEAGALIERALASIAKALVKAGVRRLVVAGGETSGAVVSALDLSGLRIGVEIDPGVPWTTSLAEPRLALALKSGNFGTDDFFLKAFELLP